FAGRRERPSGRVALPSQHLIPQLPRRPAADETGPRGRRLLDRLRLLKRITLAVAGIAGNGRSGGCFALRDAVQFRAADDRRGNRRGAKTDTSLREAPQRTHLIGW